MANETTLRRETANWYAASEFLEILAAAVAGVGLILAWKQWYVVLLITLFLLLLAVLLRIRGDSRKATAEELRKDQDRSEMHVVTKGRLATLKSVNAGEDVFAALEPLSGQKPISAEELIRCLENALGSERAQETFKVVRRYTRTTPSEPPKTDELRERDAAGAKERGQTLMDPPATPAPGSP